MDVQPFSRSQSGFSLIESLIAVFVLSVGLLGIAGLHTQSLQATQSALNRTRAILLSEDVFERIIANRGEITSYNWTISPTSTPTTDLSTYSEATQEDRDEAHWKSVLQNRDMGLPRGQAQVIVAQRAGSADSYDVTVVIQWQEGLTTEQLRLTSVVNTAI